MWVVIYNRRWVYYPYKEYRYETEHYSLALAVYTWWYFRYVMSVFPIRSIRMYKVINGVPELKSYSKQKRGDR